MISNLYITILIGFFVGGVAGYLGAIMVMKRMSLVGDALSHVALPGMALGLVYGFNPFLGALFFLVLGIFIIWKLEKMTKLPIENLVGIIFTASLAVGILITPEPELIEALFGDISTVQLWDLPIIIIFSIVIFIFTKIISKKIIFSVISDDLARSKRINTDFYNLIYLFMVAAVVALGVKFAGSLLMGALVIIPAAASKNAAGSFRQYSYGAAVIGSFSAVLGIILSNIFVFPPGAAIVLVAVFIFILMLKWRRN